MAICEAAKRMRETLMRVVDNKCIVCVGVLSDCRVDLNMLVACKAFFNVVWAADWQNID